MTDTSKRRTAYRRWIVTTGAVASIMLLFTIFFIFRPSVPAAADAESLVIIVRHGNAPGSGEPKGFNHSDCSTQRNLSEKGREQARQIGDRFRARQIRIGKVLASPLCRTRQTAALMKIGPVQSAPAFDDLSDNGQNAGELVSRERSIINAWHGPGALVIVTHGSNIRALTGLRVDQGAVVVVDTRDSRMAAKLFDTASK